MEKLEIGCYAPDGEIETSEGKTVRLKNLMRKKTVLFFLRDASCVLTQDYLDRLKTQAKVFEEQGLTFLVVVNSSKESAETILELQSYPFIVLCDEKGRVYERYGVGCAKDKEHLGNAQTMKRVAVAYAAGYKHGKDTGNPLRLPAVFVAEANGTLSFVRYGIYGDDLPDPVELSTIVTEG